MTLSEVLLERAKANIAWDDKKFWHKLSLSSRAGTANSIKNWVGVKLRAKGFRCSVQGLRDYSESPNQEKDEPAHQHKETRQYSGDGSETLTVESTRLRSVEDVVLYHRIDTSIYSVTPIESTFWEVGMKGPDGKPLTMPLHRLKCKISPIALERPDYAALKEALLQSIPTIPSGTQSKPRFSGILAEVNISDFHLGKSPVKGEWGIEEASKTYVAAVECFALECEKQGVEKILLVSGNDFLHFDSSKGTTTGGTPVGQGDIWGKILATGALLQIAAAKRLSQVAPVDIISVLANHDHDSTISIREILAASFAENDRVNVLQIKSKRSAYVWGKNLIAFAHGDMGDTKKMAYTLPIEFPEEYAATKYKFLRFGHLHRSQKDFIIIPDHVEHFGLEVVICPSLSPTDKWHQDMGFIGNMRRAKTFFYGKNEGLFLERTFSL